MDCEICLEPFDLTGKRPKSLPCAHNTFCLACLGRLQTPSCPMCRTEFTRAASLPDNFSLMRVLELQLANRSEPSIVPTAPPLEPSTSAATQEDDWWCVDCETVAGALCREQHFALRLEAVKPGKEDKAQQDASSVTAKQLRDDWTRDWWCVECQAVAKDVCRDEHLVLRHKAAQLRREEEVATRPTSSKNENLGIKRRSSPSSDSSRLSMNLENLHLKDKKTCEACKEPIIGAITHAKDKHFHPDHFVCAYCHHKLGDFYFKDERFCCVDDYHTLFSPRCALCQVPIRGRSTTAMQKTWHPEHFCCFHCHKPFGGESFYTENGKPYCRKDYASKFAPKCHGCKEPIMEPYTTSQGLDWHKTCFSKRT